MPSRPTPLLTLLLALLLCTTATASPVAPDNALITLPDGDPPKAGWPCIVLLHGYGTNKEDFDLLSAMLAQHNVAAFSVDAPLELGNGRRSWPRDNTVTYATLEPTLEFIRKDARFDESRVFAGGFSQGGYHSLLLGKAHPDEFTGLLVIAPGGGSDLPEGWQGEDVEQPLYLLFGTQESERIRGLVDRAAKEWQDAGQRVRVEDHPGGHTFPADWETVLGNAMVWLLEDQP